ncbi:hypothetical protein Tco_1133892, partial [Tanacetum coccineum]
QADCDLKATNIILQGLPSDIYSLVNHHRVAKDLWERIQLLMQDLHTINFDQLHAYLQQHELDANEVRIMRERNHDSLALFSPTLSPQYGSIHPTQHYSTTHPSIPLVISYPSTQYSNAYTSTVHQDAYPQPQSVPQIEYIVSTVNQQTHQAEFLPRGRSYGKTGLKPMRKRDATWFRDKVLLVEAQGSGKVLNEEELEFLADLGVAEGPVTQTVITHNAAYQVDYLDAYDFDCDDFSTAKAVLMANLSSYGSDVLSGYQSLTTLIMIC